MKLLTTLLQGRTVDCTKVVTTLESRIFTKYLTSFQRCLNIALANILTFFYVGNMHLNV